MKKTISILLSLVLIAACGRLEFPESLLSREGFPVEIQQDFFDINAEQFQKMKRLDEVVDRINRVHGSETIVLGAQQYSKPGGKGRADVFANAIKHEYKSPNPTTRWSDIIKIH